MLVLNACAGVSSLSCVGLLTLSQHYKYRLPRSFEFLRTIFYYLHSLLSPLPFTGDDPEVDQTP